MGFFANVKSLWENRKVLGPVGNAVMEIKASAVKDGWKTTEFWGKTIVQVLTVLAIFKPELKLDPAVGLQLVALAETLYHAFRVLVKANPPVSVVVAPLPEAPAAVPVAPQP